MRFVAYFCEKMSYIYIRLDTIVEWSALRQPYGTGGLVGDTMCVQVNIFLLNSLICHFKMALLLLNIYVCIGWKEYFVVILCYGLLIHETKQPNNEMLLTKIH